MQPSVHTTLQPPKVSQCMQCWHGGLRTVASLKKSMHATVKEYLANPESPASLREAQQSLRELAVPHYHHEYIKQILSAAFDRPQQVAALASLLHFHSNSGARSAFFAASDGFCVILSGLHCYRKMIGNPDNWTQQISIVLSNTSGTSFCDGGVVVFE